MTYVCITGNEQSPAALQQRVEQVLASHSRVLCELRLDFLDLNPAAAFGFLARLPGELAPRLILTQRLKASGTLAGGNCGWDVVTWQSWWRDVMALRPWYAVDLDWLVLDRLAGESLAWRGKFRSRHSFFSLHAPLREIEQSLPEIIASAKEHEAGVKIACPVESARDLAKLSDLSRQLEGLPIKIVVAMGAAGRPWRWSPLAGDVTYFAVENARATAPGQEPFTSVLPYLSTRQRPDLYLLLGDNPENRYGEERWNRSFYLRGNKARYLNGVTTDEPGAAWAENCLHWMEGANVKGASVTKPYKISFPSPTNTLMRSSDKWERANTDGPAVDSILRRHGMRPGSTIVVAGGGGAAHALKDGLKDYDVKLWVREPGGKLGPSPDGLALISTWPGQFQEALVQSIPAAQKFRLVIDAQLSRAKNESPLAQWCAQHKVDYEPGSLWWREQARAQDQIWFGADRLGQVKQEILSMVPESKSETLRALAIAAACGALAEIRGGAQNEDTEIFLRALEQLGMSLDKTVELLRLFPPSTLKPTPDALHMGDGATGLRILAALSVGMESAAPLRLDGSARLRERPSEELRKCFGVAGSHWPLEIPCGQPLPTTVSLEHSSQFATAFLIAAAGEIYRGKMNRYDLAFTGELRSETYINLTCELLREAGFAVETSPRHVGLTLAEKRQKFQFTIEKDASSLAFLEVFARRWGLATFFTSSRQGDGKFPEFLGQLEAGQKLSLKNHPDLAPPLWAAAVLLKLRIEVVDCPQLHWKESDRAKMLAAAATQLGAPAEEMPDGFWADFREWVPPAQEVFLRTGADHRLAMAFGLLSTDYPQIIPDSRDCVRKSFPNFWRALSLLEEALPG